MPEDSTWRSNLPLPTNMPANVLGRTGLRVPSLALGTVELGLDYGISVPGDFGKPRLDDAVSLVHAALDAGINFIDTARAYGTSEEVLGRALQGRRQEVALATKVATQDAGGRVPDAKVLKRQMLSGLETSLTQLQTEYIDIWQVHNVDQATLDQIDVVADVFEEARTAGKVRYCGGSFYGVESPSNALEYDLFDVMQVTYSILDQRLADHFFARARRRDVGIVARSVLLKGALTDRAEHLPSHLDVLRLRRRALNELIKEANLSATTAQVAIAFALAQPAIHAVVIGVRSVHELRSNLHALSLELDETLYHQIAALRLDDADLLNPSTWGIP